MFRSCLFVERLMEKRRFAKWRSLGGDVDVLLQLLDDAARENRAPV